MKKISIILPTINRHILIKETLEYYKDLDCNIIIADGSKDAYNHEIPSNCQYLHIPAKVENEFDSYNFLERYCRAIELIDTEYVLIRSDRRFITNGGIKECIDFLENNNDFSAVHGRWLNCTTTDTYYIYKPIYYIGMTHSITAENPSERLLETFLLGYNPSYYALTRINVIEKYYEILNNKAMNNIYCLELALQSIMAILGKIKRIDSLYGFMLPHEIYNKKGEMFNLVTGCSVEYITYIKYITELLINYENIEYEEAKKIVILSRNNIRTTLFNDEKEADLMEYIKLKNEWEKEEYSKISKIIERLYIKKK